MKTLNYLFTLGLLGSAILYAENEPIKKEDLLIFKRARTKEQKEAVEHVFWCRENLPQVALRSKIDAEKNVVECMCEGRRLSDLLMAAVKGMPLAEQKEVLVELSHWTNAQK